MTAEPASERPPASRPFPQALWMWIPDSLRAAFQQADAEPDPDDRYQGRYLKHSRPHLVPIGYVLIMAPVCVVNSLLFPAIPSLASWIVLATVGLVWSLALYVQHKRGQSSQ